MVTGLFVSVIDAATSLFSSFLLGAQNPTQRPFLILGSVAVFALTSRSHTVGMKSYPIPSTSYDVVSVSFSDSGSARIEPNGSTPTTCIIKTKSIINYIKLLMHTIYLVENVLYVSKYK